MGSSFTFFKEWSALRRFFQLTDEQRSLVFYAEDGSAWTHFEPMISHLTQMMDRDICYLTSSHTDPILETANARIRSFCVGEGAVRTWLFSGLRAGVFVMTMPDIETFHIKRSRACPVHYVYVFHSIVSTHMIYRTAAFDGYDTVFCVGPHHQQEIRMRESQADLPTKKLVEHGYGRLDTILATPHTKSGHRQPLTVLVAPSWGPQGLLESAGLELVRILVRAGYRVIVRPHPMTVRKAADVMRALSAEAAQQEALTVDTDMGSVASLETSDIMISDWSGAALEYAFGLERPVLFIDVPRKINNPGYEELGCEPLEVSIRTRVGQLLPPDRLSDAPAIIERLCQDPLALRESIRKARDETVFNVGRSGEVGAEYLARLVDEARGGTPIA